PRSRRRVRRCARRGQARASRCGGTRLRVGREAERPQEPVAQLPLRRGATAGSRPLHHVPGPGDAPVTDAAYLALSDGTVFSGRAVGARGSTAGEVVFHTGCTGYQEVLTDPSYCGQIVVMTTPHIGNYGVNANDNESRRPFLSGYAMRQMARRPSNWRAEEDLPRWLERSGVVSIEGIDTRAVTRHVRAHGAMPGSIAPTAAEALERARAAPSMEGRDLVALVTAEESYVWEPDRG